MNGKNENSTQLLCRCLTAVFFLFASALIFLPIAEVGGTLISTWDMTHLSREISAVAGDSIVVGNVVDEYVSSYLPFLLVLMLLPLIEAGSILILKSRISVWIGLIGGCVNGIMLIAMYSKLHSVTETFSTWLSFFGGDEAGNAVTQKKLVFILWTVVYVGIIILSLFHLYQIYGERKPKIQKTTVFPQPDSEEYPVVEQQWKKQKTPETDQMRREEQTIYMDSPDGILEGKGELSGSTYSLKRDQVLRVGSPEDGCEIPIKGLLQGAYCKIEYRQSEQAYLLTPNQKQFVYLESGQPLGADRTYTIAKGKRIYLKERTQMFECK